MANAGGEELPEWRIGDGEHARPSLRSQELAREQGGSPLMSQPQPILGVDDQPRRARATHEALPENDASDAS